jgi:hypothetical protein
LAHCEICRDEIEGLASLENKENLTVLVAKLNSQVDSRIKREKESTISRIKKNPDFRIKRVLAIAAAVVLIFSIGYIVRFSMQTLSDKKTADLIQNESQKKFESPAYEIGKADSLIETKESSEKSPVKAVNSERNRGISKNEIVKDEIIEYEDDKSLVDLSTNELSSETDDFGSKSIVEEKEEIVSDKIAANDSDISADYTVRAVSGNVDEKSKKDVQAGSNASSLSAVEEISTNDFKKSANKTTESAGNIFLDAKNLFDSGKFKEALPLFRKVQNMDDYRLWEDAQWFEALSLLKSDKKREARKLLGKISTSNSRYKGDAIDKLKEIE